MSINKTEAILRKLECFFVEYSSSFLTGESDFDRNIILKQEHSLRVAKEAAAIANAEGFNPHDCILAEISGLLHDIGRFEQYRKHRTFVDAKSENHGKLGVRIITELKLLSELEQPRRVELITAISLHNRKNIAPAVKGRCLNFARLLRDADKLDIMKVVLDYYSQDEVNASVTLDLVNSREITAKVKDALLRRENPLIADFKTVTDFKLTQLSWVFDLNYQHSFNEFKKRGYHLTLKKHLPATPEVEEICQNIFAYLENACSSRVIASRH
ncbi:MAG: HD domain-containing protein [Victivallaceae bacterium]